MTVTSNLYFYLNNFTEFRNPNGDITPLSKHPIDLDSLRHFGYNLNRQDNEFLPQPSLLSSSSSATKDTTLTSSQSQTSRHSPLTSSTKRNQNDAIVMIPEKSEHFVHHALSSAKKRHRRSFNSFSFKRRIIRKRFIMKRNLPNHHLSKPSIETGMDDSNDTELDGSDVEENGDDYMQRIVDNTAKSGKYFNGNDILDNVDENDVEQTSQLAAPYWDAYDTVNQLYLEISK